MLPGRYGHPDLKINGNCGEFPMCGQEGSHTWEAEKKSSPASTAGH